MTHRLGTTELGPSMETDTLRLSEDLKERGGVMMNYDDLFEANF